MCAWPCCGSKQQILLAANQSPVAFEVLLGDRAETQRCIPNKRIPTQPSVSGKEKLHAAPHGASRLWSLLCKCETAALKPPPRHWQPHRDTRVCALHAMHAVRRMGTCSVHPYSSSLYAHPSPWKEYGSTCWGPDRGLGERQAPGSLESALLRPHCCRALSGVSSGSSS